MPVVGTPARSRRAGALLWAAQAPLSLVFLFAGGAKLMAPLGVLAAQTPVPPLVLRGVGVLEVLGAMGLLPGLLQRWSAARSAGWAVLPPLAAAGLLLLMAGAAGVTLAGRDRRAVAAPLATGTLLLVVLVGRRRGARPGGSTGTATRAVEAR